MAIVKASLCLSIALALSACSDNVSLETHLSNAKSYLNENKINESIIELKNAIRLDSKNGEVRFLLGQVYLDLGDGPAAAKELERAKSLNYASNKVLPSLARAYILTDSDEDVLLLNQASETLAPEERSHYLAYRTLAALRTEQPDVVQESIDLAESLAPNSLYTLLAKSYQQLSQNKYNEAKTLASRILTIQPEQVDALMLQGQVLMLTKEFQAAADSFKAYLTLQPRAGIVQLLLADALLKAGQYDEAEKYADSILASIDKQPFAHYIKATIAFNNNDYKAASEHAEIALSVEFNQFNLTLIAGASAFYLQNWQQSHRHLQSIVNYLPQDHQARKMLAVAQLELGFVDELSATIGDFNAESNADSEFVSSISYKLLQLGATEEAKQLLEQADDTKILTAGENARQGILKLMMNDPSGIQDLEDAIKLEPDFIEAELALAFAAIARNELEKAKTISAKWLKKYPQQAGTYNLLAAIETKENNYEAAEKSLAKSLSLKPDNIYALTEQLKLARIKKDETLSKQRADHLIAVAPNDNKALRLYFGTYQSEMALKPLQAAYENNQTDIDKAILLAEAMMSLSQEKNAERLLVEWLEKPNLTKRYWQTLVVIYTRGNDQQKLQSTLEGWIKNSPYHKEPIILLGDLHVRLGNKDRALSIIQRGLGKYPDDLTLQLIKMQLLLDNKQVLLAKSHYKTLASSNINTAIKQGIQGRILLLEEYYSDAIPKLEVLVKEFPSSQNVIHLTNAYVGNDDNPNAIKALESFLKASPDDNRIKTILAGLYIKNDTAQAINTYEDAVKKQPKNVIAHNNLAWLYMENNELDKALEHAEKAFKLAPKIANVVDTYAKVLLAKGDNRGALKHSAEAVELTKGQDVDIQLNYAQVLLANSRKNEAKQLLDKITTETKEQNKKKLRLLNQ